MVGDGEGRVVLTEGQRLGYRVILHYNAEREGGRKEKIVLGIQLSRALMGGAVE